MTAKSGHSHRWEPRHISGTLLLGTEEKKRGRRKIIISCSTRQQVCKQEAFEATSRLVCNARPVRVTLWQAASAALRSDDQALARLRARSHPPLSRTPGPSSQGPFGLQLRKRQGARAHTQTIRGTSSWSYLVPGGQISSGRILAWQLCKLSCASLTERTGVCSSGIPRLCKDSALTGLPVPGERALRLASAPVAGARCSALPWSFHSSHSPP